MDILGGAKELGNEINGDQDQSDMYVLMMKNRS